MSKLHALQRYYRGVLLVFIAEKLGAGDKQTIREVSGTLHKAFKEAFDIETTATLTEREMREYLASIRTYMSVEKGILCPIQHDPVEIDEMDMKEFIKLTMEFKS